MAHISKKNGSQTVTDAHGQIVTNIPAATEPPAGVDGWHMLPSDTPDPEFGSDEWYLDRVYELEGEGIPTSDAQAIAEGEVILAQRNTPAETAANGEQLIPHGTLAVAEAGRVRVEMMFDGEGFSGDFDEDDEDDRQLVRFEVSIRATGDEGEDELIEYGVDAGEWGAPKDGSWCTGIEAAQDPEFIEAWAARFAEDLNRVVESGDGWALRGMISAATSAGDTESFPWAPTKDDGFVFGCLWKGLEVEVEADSAYAAQQAAVPLLQARAGRRKVKGHDITVMLLRKGGEDVVHVADF